MFELKSVVVELVPAWVECDYCNGSGSMGSVHGMAEAHFPCEACDCKGGEWHPDTKLIKFNCKDKGIGQAVYIDVSNYEQKRITKSTILTREHGVCSKSKATNFYGEECQMGEVFQRRDDDPECWGHVGTCLHCAGTGAEPDTASPWRVKGDSHD